MGHDVTLLGSGRARAGTSYRFIHVPAVAREKFEGFPSFPPLRSETAWEEATFAVSLLTKYRPSDFDLVATCAYPFTQWALRRPPLSGTRPRNIFITQNGDWPAYSKDAEYRLFACDGLVCTNPDYYERNRAQFRCALIPNGVDLDRFAPGPGERSRFNLPEGPLVLMVSALIASKNVAEGIAAVARIPDAVLVVAGDGPLRVEVQQLADELLPGRYRRLTAPAIEMPALYRSAEVFMHLSVDESFGNVFVEALASGLPVVAYDTPRTRWIVGDEIHSPKSRKTEDLADAIASALQSRKGAAGARQRAMKFGWPQIARQYADFFEGIVGD
jgi:glycosyltransferase involved in cell wall biosynthesis